MKDIYIATPTQADYDALMRLAEAAGYRWRSHCKPTEEYNFDSYGRETVVWMQGNMLLEYCDKSFYENNQGATIETIPNLADIKEIWKVSRENRDAFTMKHRLPPHYKSARKLYVICDEYSGTYTTKENEIYEALAVEYKPQESEEVMTGLTRLATPEIELPSDYNSLVNDIKAWNNINQKALLSVEANHSKLLANIILDNKWPANLLMNQVIRLIHIADVRFIDPKRKWRLKNENTEYSYIDFYTRNLKLMWGLYNGSVDLNGMTETEFKTSLASSKCPFVFEDFEAEEV